MANPAARPEDEDQTGVCWRDDQWLQFFPLTRQSALDYFSLSPFYDRSCNNEQAKLQGMDSSKLACAPWWMLFAVAWCTAVLLSAQCHSHLPASHFHLLPAAVNHLRLLKLTCCSPAALAFCFVCPKLMLAAWRSRRWWRVCHRTLPPGMEYELQDAQEPHLFVICRQLRTAPRAVVKQAVYYILDGSVYQAPSLHAALSSRIVRDAPSLREGCRGPGVTGYIVRPLVASRRCVCTLRCRSV